jgi:hypothetical protein
MIGFFRIRILTLIDGSVLQIDIKGINVLMLSSKTFFELKVEKILTFFHPETYPNKYLTWDTWEVVAGTPGRRVEATYILVSVSWLACCPRSVSGHLYG